MNKARMLILFLFVALALAVATSPAATAKARWKRGTYTGETSQGNPIKFKVRRRSIRLKLIAVQESCFSINLNGPEDQTGTHYFIEQPKGVSWRLSRRGRFKGKEEPTGPDYNVLKGRVRGRRVKGKMRV